MKLEASEEEEMNWRERKFQKISLGYFKNMREIIFKLEKQKNQQGKLQETGRKYGMLC